MMAMAMGVTVALLSAGVPAAMASYEDPRKGGCAAGEMPAKFPFGGCMCMPKCNAGTCPAAPGAWVLGFWLVFRRLLRPFSASLGAAGVEQ